MDTNNGFTPSTAKLTIRNATNTVNTNGIVYIADGIYTGPDNRGINIGKNMSIIGQSQTGTIIDAEKQSQFFTISDVSLILQNMTLKNGYDSNNGGAIEIYAINYMRSNLAVTNCTFINNSARHGGAIETGVGALYYGYPVVTCTVTGCTFTNNQATYGGAIYNACDIEGSPFSLNCMVIGSTFTNNQATYGGAIYNEYNNDGGTGSVDCTANFNRFYNNTAAMGGDAICNFYASVDAENNWWGSNDNPSSLIYGNVDFSPWLFMTINATPSTINNSETSLVTVSFNNYSSDGTTSTEFTPVGSNHIPDGTPVSLATTLGSIPGTIFNTVVGIVTATFTANQVGTAYVSGLIDSYQTPYDPNNPNTTPYTTINIDPAGHVSITKTVDNSTPHYWSWVTYTIQAYNNGPNDVEGLQITDIIPTGLTLVSVDTHGFGSYSNGIWDIGTLLNDTTATLTLVVNATSTGTFTNWANVTAQNTHDIQAWSKDSATINVPAATDIAVIKTFYDYNGVNEITSANYWEIISSRILVTNNGPDTATNVVISDILGPGLSFIDKWWVKWDINSGGWDLNDASFDPVTMTWTIASLPAGQTAALDIMTNLTSTGTLQNYAEMISSQTYDWNQSNNNDTAYLTVPAASYLSLTKEFMDLPWGNVITTAYYNDKIYAIVKVQNQGPDATSLIDVLDILDGLTWTGNYYVYRTPGSYPNTETAWVLNDPTYPFNGTNWNVGSLSTMIGSSRWLAIEVIVNQTGTVSNYAETVNQSTYSYRGYANYTAYLTSNVTPTSVTVNSPSGYNGDTVDITATLTDTIHNTPVNNKAVTITVNGDTHTDYTDINGQITWNYLINSMDAGEYTINATFNGDDQYNSSKANSTLTVNLIPTNITVDDVRGNKGDTVTLNAVLTDYQGNPLVGETVEFWIDNIKVGENTTDSTGTAQLDYIISQTHGGHNLTAIFSGTTFYQGSNATGELYVPTANLYIQISSDNANPHVGEKFTVTYKLGNKGPDAADNVTIIIPIPEGFHVLQISGDGNWTVNSNGTITWTFTNVAVGDPYLYLYGYTTNAGSLLFTGSIYSDTYNLNTIGVNSLTLHATPKETPETNAAVTTTSTVGMQTTGIPLVGMVLAILMVLGGLISTRKKQ